MVSKNWTLTSEAFLGPVPLLHQEGGGDIMVIKKNVNIRRKGGNTGKFSLYLEGKRRGRKMWIALDTIYPWFIVQCSGLDMLAAIATQELHGGSEKEGRRGSEDGGERRGSSDGRGRGSVQPKKLAEMEVVTMEQIRSMSGEIFFIYELFLIFNLARNTFRIPT